MIARFRGFYGAGPLHLIAALVSFVIAAYALSRALSNTGNPDRIVLWLGGSIVGHDLILFPIYALLGVVAAGLLLRRGNATRLRIAALNHLRFPALMSGLLLLVWYPLVNGPAERGFMRTTGLSKDVYLGRWLWLTAALFVGSALIFALRYRALSREGSSHEATVDPV